MTNLTKYKGMSQKEITILMSNQFSSFLDSFKRPSNMIKVSEVRKEFISLRELINDLKSHVVDEKIFWYSDRKINGHYDIWCNVHDLLCETMEEANNYMRRIDWSKYEK